jgi:hypothetical protein
MFKTLRDQAKKTADDSEFQVIVDQSFTEEVNGKTEELKQGGGDIQVTKANLEEYISLLCDRRLNSAHMQMRWIKKGVERIVPISVMKLLSWEDVEERTCGLKQLDIEKLKKITEYENCRETDQVIKFFFNVLAKLEVED